MTGFDDSERAARTGRTRWWCDNCTRLLPVDGAAVLSRAGSDTSALLYATDPTIARLDDLEFVTGEGPCLDAYWNGAPVLEPDVNSEPAAGRWQWFSREAAALGVAAIFAFPLRVGTVTFGVFSLYRRAAGELFDHDFDVASGLSQAAARMVLADVAESSGELGAVLDVSMFGQGATAQALGVIAAQRAGSIQEARTLLRGTAYAQNRHSHDVAKDILAHRITFTPDAL